MMRNRVAWVAASLCCCVVAGCGSANPIRGLLGGDGIGKITFGQTPDRVAVGLERLFGRPSSAGAASSIGYFRSGCGFDGEIIWAGLAARSNGANSDGLTVYFKHSRFVGYSYGPPYGGSRAPAVRDGLMLSTSKGLVLDEALARARRLYGQAFVVSSQAQGTPPSTRLERLPAWEVRTASGRIYGFIDSPNGPLSTYQRTIGSISAGAIPNTPCAANAGAAGRSPQTMALPGSNTTLLLWPAGPPIFGDLPGGGPGTTVNVDDLSTGKVAVRRIPGIAGGDYPYQIVAVGRRLVYNSGQGVVTISDDLAEVPRALGAATWFVPSANGRVLLVHAKNASPVSVRSVSVATGARAPAIALPKGTQVVSEGTDRGLLLSSWSSRRGSGVLELWRPGRAPRRLPVPADGIVNGVAADARVIAYGSACRAETARFSNGPTGYTVCARLGVLDLVDGRRVSFPAPRGTLGWVSGVTGLDTALAPGDTMLAAQAAISPARKGATRLFVLRLNGRGTSPVAVPESTAPLYARTAWTTSGSWLLYQGPGARLHAFRLPGRSQTLGVHCCAYAAMVSTPDQSR